MITALILTHDEAKHIKRCMESLRGVVDRIVVVDSGSSDSTVELARSAGADTYRNPWVNYAEQFNWALDNTAISTTWVLRIDADEYLSDALRSSVAERCAAAGEEIDGFTVNRRIVFLGRAITHGSMYPIAMLRVFRFGSGRCEQRWMDEHISVPGAVEHIPGDVVDENLNSLTWWTAKHNAYSNREVIDAVLNKGDPTVVTSLGAQASRKRWLKDNVYGRLPLGVRPMVYFLYRYLFRAGFLDGWQGLVFHVLQGFWYRFLVDAKIWELRLFARKHELSLEDSIQKLYGHSVWPKDIGKRQPPTK